MNKKNHSLGLLLTFFALMLFSIISCSNHTDIPATAIALDSQARSSGIVIPCGELVDLRDYVILTPKNATSKIEYVPSPLTSKYFSQNGSIIQASETIDGDTFAFTVTIKAGADVSTYLNVTITKNNI